MGDTVASPPTSAAQDYQYQHQHQHQGLPSIRSLTNGLPRSSHHSDQLSATESTRDSGTWPQPSKQNKHNSANSGLQVHTLLNPDDSPPRNSGPTTPLSARMPTSAHSNGVLPSINQGFSEAPNRDSYASIDSRRSSVDSRMHQGFNNLYINNNPTSPYDSHNNSQVSLAASLRRPNGGAPLSPLSGRSSMRGHAAPRVAPQIMPIGRGPGVPDPTAAKPTQGYAWAFPDGPIPEEDRRDSESGDSSLGHVSRTNSLAASSVRSSIFSQESGLHNQRRLDDDATTHHHSLQHRAMQNIQADHLAAAAGGNYSRTPELRVSHKLAERKRRSEMKDLFEDLNKAVPASGGTKASKWEILTKAIEHIRNTQHNERHLANELQRLQHDSDYARDAQKENDLLKMEVQNMHQALRRMDPNAPHVYGHFTGILSNGQPQPPQQAAPPPPQTNGVSLPPLSATGAGGPSGHAHGGGPGYAVAAPQQQQQQPPPGAMQGVEYGYGAR